MYNPINFINFVRFYSFRNIWLMKKILSLICLFLLFACANELDKPASAEISQIPQFTADEGVVDVTLTSNSEWAIGMDADSGEWCSITPNSGTEGTHKLKIKVRSNRTHEDRTAMLTLTAGNMMPKNYVVVQRAAGYILSDKDEYEVNPEGETLEFAISSDEDLKVTVPSWAEAVTEKEGTHGDTKLKITFQRNYKMDDRDGTVVIDLPGVWKRIKIMQKSLVRECLMGFYEAAGGENWKNNMNWGSSVSPESWYGLKFDYVYPTIDSDELEPKLGVILLSDNNLAGDFTESFNHLAPIAELLIHIDVSMNSLYGEIPESIGVCKRLLRFHAQSNKLTGSLPRAIEDVSQSLYLSYNNLSGDLSSYRFKASVLSLAHNNFTGTLPEIPSGATIYLMSNNNFTGQIPETHANALEDLEYYEIDFNNLSGDIPQEMQSHPRWQSCWVHILPQWSGFGFDKAVIPAMDNVVQCYDGTYLDLGREYAENEYTMLFRWEYDCLPSRRCISDVTRLYEKYKDKGFGLICSTLDKGDEEIVSSMNEVFPDIKLFWEIETYEGYNNNPCGIGFYLNFFAYTPSFIIVDKKGEIVCFGPDACVPGTIPQFYSSLQSIYDFVESRFE